MSNHSMQRVSEKISNLHAFYGGVMETIPIYVVGSMYLGLGPPSNGQAYPRWFSVDTIERRVWESALSESFTLSLLGFAPHFISPLPKDDPLVTWEDIMKKGKSRVNNWNKKWKKKIHPHFVKVPGECPISLYLPTPEGRVQKADPGCQIHYSWEHVFQSLEGFIDPRKKPGVLVINSYFFTQLHDKLGEALEQFKDWLICVDFGRLDYRGLSLENSVKALRRQFDKIDIQFTSKHDLVELFYSELKLERTEDHYSDIALDKAFQYLESKRMVSPAMILVKTENQNRRLWYKNNPSGMRPKEYQYLGLDLTYVWYPHFGGIFNGAFIASLLHSTCDRDIHERAVEATELALATLCHCGDELVMEKYKAMEKKKSHIGFRQGTQKREEAEKAVEEQDSVQENFPIQSILKKCKEIEERDKCELEPMAFLRRCGCMQDLIGFRTCPDVISDVKDAASCELSVLIHGENGTGKGVVARSIHKNSSRKDGPFVRVDMAARNQTMFFDEMIGHEPNAFTDSGSEKTYGFLQNAEGGTLLLDDLQEVQADVLSILLPCTEDDEDERKFYRTGSSRDKNRKPILVDVRFIATVNKSLDKLPQLREQFIHRLGGIEIFLPPLRERREEILPLAEYFISLGIKKTKRPHDLKLSDRAKEALINYNWPGNVRELRYAIRRAIDTCRGIHQIDFMHLPKKIKSYSPDQDRDQRRVNNTLWEELRAEERVFVSLWFEIIPFLCKASDKQGYINWSRAAAMLIESQIPVTKVQVDRKLKSAVLDLKRGRHPEELMKVSPEELAKTLLRQREERTRQVS